MSALPAWNQPVSPQAPRYASHVGAGARRISRGRTVAPPPVTSTGEGLTVRILHRVDGEGILSIRYRNLEQLDDITRRLATGPIVGAATPSAQQLKISREVDAEVREAEEREEANKGPRIRSL